MGNSGLTLSSRHLFSLMAPRHPRKPVTMTTLPRVMMRLAAESDGKEGDRVAKLPWDTDSHKPTPSRPHPPSWNTGNRSFSPDTRWCQQVCVFLTQNMRLKRKSMYLMQQMHPRAILESTAAETVTCFYLENILDFSSVPTNVEYFSSVPKVNITQ